MDLKRIRQQLIDSLEELVETAQLTACSLLVIGCSTSEVQGKVIGKAGSLEIAENLFDAIQAVRDKSPFRIAIQCCEHLNRALLVEREDIQRFNLQEVSVVPVPEAGGALPALAWKTLENPAMVSGVSADAGIDIGDTFIGMQLKHVAVPVRLSIKEIGQAHVTAAVTRPPMIGGPRAVYTD